MDELIKNIKTINSKDKEILAKKIREEVIKTVSNTGGHLASNLGVVELTIALHSVFECPKDKIIWDVGHQSYIHKILSGRKDKMNTIRKFEGLAGFPKTSESTYDSFNTGHSSTSISAALGMARARDLKKEKNYVIAVIGDGALTGGMALEALNDAGASNTNLIVILNDNEMSIEKNVGGISNILTNFRMKKLYTNSNKYIKEVTKKIPLFGNCVVKIVRRCKYAIKQLVIPNMFFEDLGFKYLGPVNGNKIDDVEAILKSAKDLEGPILIHMLTKKGKGYIPAEEKPDKFHSTSGFNIETGESKTKKSKDYSKVFGDKIVSLAKDDDKIVAITAAMTSGVGLVEFSEKYPQRFFDVGIAEQHSLTMAAGMAINGLKPVISIYSSFYQRGYDQVIHDICMQKLHVVMCIDRAGIVGNDGETHQGILDIAFFRIVPNLTFLAPKNFFELEEMLEFAVNLNTPVAIRYPRGSEQFEDENREKQEKIQLGKAESLTNFEKFDVCIFALGKMVKRAFEASENLLKDDIKAEVINLRFITPIDESLIIEKLKKRTRCVVIEDGCKIGGVGSSIEHIIMKNNIEADIEIIGYPNEYIEHGDVNILEEKYGLDTKSIVEKTKKMLEVVYE